MRSRLRACVLAAVVACSSSSSNDSALSDEESRATVTGGESMTATQESVALADSLFDFDPTIDPKATAEANAAAIAANIQANLGAACGKVTTTGTTVTVAFGPPPGCALANGVQVSGTVSVAVSAAGGTITCAITFTDVVMNGASLSGSSTFTTTTGTTFDVAATLTSGGKTLVAAVNVVGSASTFTISGTCSVTEDGATTSLTLQNVVHATGQCYATAGSMTVSKGAVSETITFDANTPSTGKATAQIGRRTTTITLPAYGSCPSASKSRDAGRVRP